MSVPTGSAPSRPRYQEKYRNKLREARVGAKLTRDQLLRRCRTLHDEDHERFVSLGLTTLKQIEAGSVRPRLKRAVTLAAALGATVEDLFPLGWDDTARNPEGRTRVPDDPQKRGRPRKQ